MKNNANFNMYKLQEQIKNNTVDIQSYVSDLSDWTNSMNQKDKTSSAAGK
jgi:hypothetical protein